MVRSSCLLACCALAVILVVPAAAYPSPSYYYRDEGQYEPEEIMDMLNRLGNLLQIQRRMGNAISDDITSEKRGLDLGLGRGYSGTIQAKHLMGLAAANNPEGPGRRRRDVQ